MPWIMTVLLILSIYCSERRIDIPTDNVIERMESVNVEKSDEDAKEEPVRERFNPFESRTEATYKIMDAYSSNNLELNDSQPPLKRILFWNDAYGSRDYGIGVGVEGFQRLNCPVSRCYATANRTWTAVEDFDAIVFHLRTYLKSDRPDPSKRKASQRYVLWSLESPQYNMQDIPPLNGIFNWTFTYRLDSDVVQPYGWIEPTGAFGMKPRVKEIEPALHAAMADTSRGAGKSKLIAWFVSNCDTKSKREHYVEALRKHVAVDVYGECGDLHCDRNNVTGCYAMLQRDYKFYLSFENSFCKDYATEKLFSVLALDVVPVVFGGADYAKMAPPYSYVDARNFRTALDLADYLNLLDANDHLYRQYFWWKTHYRVRNGADDLKLSMCGLCARLHVDDRPKVYDDMEKWWVRDATCKEPRPDNVFRIPWWN